MPRECLEPTERGPEDLLRRPAERGRHDAAGLGGVVTAKFIELFLDAAVLRCEQHDCSLIAPKKAYCVMAPYGGAGGCS